MASLVTEGTGSLQVALAHLFFNLTGILIWYPIPFMRRIPITIARKLGKVARLWRGFPVLYIIVVFLLFPLLMLGISALFETKSIGFTVMGVIIVVILCLIIGYLIFWCRYQEGAAKCGECMVMRQRRRETYHDLPEDVLYFKESISRLIEHTGLPVDEFDDEEMDEDA